MEKKTQIYLLAFIMSAIAGFAGYINQFSNYWVVFVLSVLVAGYTLSSVLTDKELFDETKKDWISISIFFGLEVILTILIGIVKLPYVGFFRYFNYAVQLLGIGFMIYSIVRFVLSFVDFKELIKVKEKIVKETKKSVKQEVVLKEGKVTSKVEEIIETEEVVEEKEIESFEEVNSQPEVIEIEYKKEKEIETPYMEEEL